MPETRCGYLIKRTLARVTKRSMSEIVTESDGFAQILKFSKKRIEAVKAEAQALQARVKSLESQEKYLKDKYLQIMDKAGLKKVRGDVYSIFTAQREKAVVPENIDCLPEKYVRVKTEREANKEAILDDLLKGIEIPGCEIGYSRWISAR